MAVSDEPTAWANPHDAAAAEDTLKTPMPASAEQASGLYSSRASNRRPARPAVIVAAGLFLLETSLILSGPISSGRDAWPAMLVELVAAGLAMVALLATAWRMRGQSPEWRAWGVWGLGAGLWIVLRLLRWASIDAPGVPVPVLAYLLYSSFFLLGVLVLPSVHRTPGDWWGRSLDLGILFLSVLVALWDAVLAQTLTERGLALVDWYVAAQFIASTLMLAGGTLWLLFHRVLSPRSNSLSLLALGGVILLVSNLVGDGGCVQLAWTAFFLLSGIAAVVRAVGPHASQTETALHGGASRLRPPSWETFWPFAWLVISYSLLVWSHLEQPRSFPTYAIGFGGMVLLVVVRQVIALNENHRLYGRLREQLGVRQRAEKALRESERRYRLMAENATDIIWVRDMTYRITYISPSVTRVRGYTVEEASAQTLAQAMTPDSAERAMELLARIKEEAEHLPREQILHQPWSVELELVRKDGSTLWSESSITLLLDAQGQPSAFLGVTRDIQKRKQVEMALRQAEIDLKTRVAQRTEELAETLAKTQRQAREVQSLYEIGTHLNATLDLSVVVQSVADCARELTGADKTRVAIPQSDTGRSLIAISWPEEPRVAPRVVEKSHSDDLTATLLRTGRPLVIPDAQDDPRSWPRLRARGVRQLVGVPIQVGNRVVGALIADSRQLEFFDPRKMELLTFLANQAAAAIMNAMSYAQAQQEIAERKRIQEESRQRAEELESLRQMGLEITGQLNLESVLTSFAQRAVSLLHATTGSFYLFRPDKGILERMVAIGPRNASSAVTRRYGEGLIGKVWQLGKPIFVNDYQAWAERSRAYEGSLTRAVMGVPIRWGDRFLGVSTVIADPPRQFTEADVASLELLAMQASVAIHNAQLYQDAQQEIAERKRVEAAQRDSETRLRRITDNMMDMIVQVDEKGVYLYVSPSHQSALGYSAQDLIGRSMFEHVHPDDLEGVMKQALAAWQARTSTRMEYRYKNAQGRYVWLESMGSPLLDDEGRAMGAIIESRDVTVRKQMEVALRASEERYRAISELMSDFAFSERIGPDGRRTTEWLAGAFSRITGYPADALPIGWETLIHPEDKSAMLAWSQPPKSPSEGMADELRIVTRSGDIRWLRTYVKSAPDPVNQVLYIHGAAQDITDQKRAELRTQAFADLGKRLSSTNNAENAAKIIVEAADQLLGWEACFVNLCVPERGNRMQFVLMLDTVAGKRIQTLDFKEIDPTPMLLRTLKEGPQLIFPDESENGFSQLVPFGAKTQRTHSLMYVPIHSADRIIGILSIQSYTRRAYTTESLRTLQALADHAGGALERIRAEQALRENEERYALAARGANDGLWDWDLESNQVYYSPRWKEMLGCGESEIGTTPDEWFHRVHPEDLRQLQVDLASHLDGRTPHFENEYRILHADGRWRWMLTRGLAVRNSGGVNYRIAGSQTDSTWRKAAEERLLYDALHEPLTGLPNRALFTDRLGHVLKKAKRRPGYLASVLFMDLDRFKVVNDSLGHLVGDRLLVAVARRLEVCLRATDTIARFGGDEFGILLDDIAGADDAVRTAERLQVELASPFDVDGHVLTLSASIGIALTRREVHGEADGSPRPLYQRPEEILRDSDIAMYHAKALGKSRYEIFSASMHERAVALLQFEADLRQALEREEFQLLYQPVVDAASGRITSVEALLRWQHPQRGLISPADLIPIAEETGLIVPIGEWVLRTACARTREWRSAGYDNLQIAVNFSARQFQDAHLLHLVQQVLADTGLPAEALQIEITESTAMKNVELSIETLNRLNEMGAQIAIDDFGNRYSALGNIRRFPFKILKVDQLFVRDLTGSRDNEAITTAIIAMAHSLGLKVIAEGVETEEQLKFLRAHECDEIQGYWYSPPRPADELEPLLRQHALPSSGGDPCWHGPGNGA